MLTPSLSSRKWIVVGEEMELLSLNGYNGEHISLTLKEVLGFPDKTCYEGGYDIVCTLEIVVGCYHVQCDKYYSATGALYRFADELKRCYDSLEGSAKYTLLLENDLVFEVTMTGCGHAVVAGTFQERPDLGNIFTFEMKTDQSCFRSVIQDIERIKREYGGMRGINQ